LDHSSRGASCHVLMSRTRETVTLRFPLVYPREYGGGWLAEISNAPRPEFLQKFLSTVFFFVSLFCHFALCIYPIPQFSILQVASLWKRIALRELAGCLIFFPVSYCLPNPTIDKEQSKNTFQSRFFFLEFSQLLFWSSQCCEGGEFDS
jgi:hypothetical protein